MRKRFPFYLLLIVSIISLALVGCSESSETPTTTSTSTSATTSTATHEPYEITLHGSSTGTIGSVLVFAWADMINKYHPWLKASIVEEMAPGASVPQFVQSEEKRKTGIMYMFEGQPGCWENGAPPLTPETPYKSWRIVCHTTNNVMYMLTFDPDIKTIHDFVGKKVAISPKYMITSTIYENIFKHGAGIFDQIGKVEYLNPGPGKDALISGAIDASVFVGAGDGPIWSHGDAETEVIKAKQVYYVDFTKEAMLKSNEVVQWPTARPRHVPAGVYEPDQEAFWCHCVQNGFACDADMPDEVVYEALKVLWDHIDELGSYHTQAAGVQRDRFGEMLYPEEKWHPGALKFIKEKGLEVNWINAAE